MKIIFLKKSVTLISEKTTTRGVKILKNSRIASEQLKVYKVAENLNKL